MTKILQIEVLDITSPRDNEQISPVPWHAVKSRFHCTWLDMDLAQLMLTFQEPMKLPVKFYIVQQKRYSDQSNLRCGCCYNYHGQIFIFKDKKGIVLHKSTQIYLFTFRISDTRNFDTRNKKRE